MSKNFHWVNGHVETPVGTVPRVSTALTRRDRLGTWRVRCGIGRMNYSVPPGLYAAGSPGPESHVFVTANYKMSLDQLRSQLEGLNAWIMVLDTRGVNVWCSAGKGTFGTEEIVKRIEAVRLSEIVSHRNLILPQLSATGVRAHLVRRQIGWRVIYGPVRAEDLPEFMEAGMKAASRMRLVRFPLIDRVILIPMELVVSAKYLFPIVAFFLLLSGLNAGGYSPGQIQTAGLRSVMLLLLAYFAGAAVSPVLLPWIPGRAFSSKGALVGMVAVALLAVKEWPGTGLFDNWAEASSWLLLIPAISSFLAMNFTGVSTYTSLSGVRREMRVAVPLQIAAAAAGAVIWVTGRFI